MGAAVGCGEIDWGDGREEIGSRECLWRKTGLRWKEGAAAESHAGGGATIVTSLLPTNDNKRRPLRAGPRVPAVGCQKNPSQGWPSRALCWVPEKALTRAIFLVPVATSFPAHLVPPVFP